MNFVSLARTAYTDDIKQYFASTTISGESYTSEDLIIWEIKGPIF